MTRGEIEAVFDHEVSQTVGAVLLTDLERFTHGIVSEQPEFHSYAARFSAGR